MRSASCFWKCLSRSCFSRSASSFCRDSSSSFCYNISRRVLHSPDEVVWRVTNSLSDLFLEPGHLLSLPPAPLFLLPPLLLLPQLSQLLCLALSLLLSLRSLLCFAPSHFLLGEPVTKGAERVRSVLLLWDQICAHTAQPADLACSSCCLSSSSSRSLCSRTSRRFSARIRLASSGSVVPAEGLWDGGLTTRSGNRTVLSSGWRV